MLSDRVRCFESLRHPCCYGPYHGPLSRAFSVSLRRIASKAGRTCHPKGGSRRSSKLFSETSRIACWLRIVLLQNVNKTLYLVGR